MLNRTQQKVERKKPTLLFFERSEDGKLVATKVGIYTLTILGLTVGHLIAKTLIFLYHK